MCEVVIKWQRMAEESGNSTANFLRMILISLCANFNPYQEIEGEFNCRFRSEYYYQLRSLKGKILKFATLDVSNFNFFKRNLNTIN